MWHFCKPDEDSQARSLRQWLWDVYIDVENAAALSCAIVKSFLEDLDVKKLFDAVQKQLSGFGGSGFRATIASMARDDGNCIRKLLHESPPSKAYTTLAMRFTIFFILVPETKYKFKSKGNPL